MSVLLFLLGATLLACKPSRVQPVAATAPQIDPEDDFAAAGGAYAFSPDGKWLAEIEDGRSKEHKVNCARIRLWDLTKYPSLKRGIRSDWGKVPTMSMVFPQGFFQAREAKCDVSWKADSSGFSIDYELHPGQNGPMRRFHYDLGNPALFALEGVQPQNK